MHTLTLRISGLVVLVVLALPVLLVGCNPEPHDESTGHDATADAHESTGAPTTGTSTSESSETSETSETGHAHATSETGHEHTDTTHAHTTEPEPGTTGSMLTPAQAYCQCMVVDCHDEYHGTWGEDHDMSEAMCEAAAAAVPSVGMPATQGDSIECRTYYCELAKTDPGACASAIGGGSCM